jgi:SAM-dependent methyltransferase
MAFLDALYALVIFLSAFLLFLVEPMTAKRLLPMLGGSAAVWITCLVFFQTALLAGYFYAHLAATRLRPRAQAMVHSGLLALALAALCVRLHPQASSAAWHPLFTTLRLVAELAGLPFVALAATTPLVQTWYARGAVARPRSPGWRLFALSNLGSMLALILYPVLIEPNLALRTQRLVWGVGFAGFALACAALAWRHANGFESAEGALEDAHGNGRASGAKAPLESAPQMSGLKLGPAVPGFSARGAGAPGPSAPKPTAPELTARASAARCALWVLLPAASSMLLCAVTAYLGQNIAAVPLLWIVPLAAYLLSFIVTFAGPRWYLRSYGLRALALAAATIGYLLVKQISVPLAISVPVYVGALFVFCYFCHGELYRLRPAAARTTSFYLLLSLGSALGAIAVGVIFPLVFRANYDLAASLVFLVVLAVAATWTSGLAVRFFWLAATAAMVWAAVLNVRVLGHNSIAQLRGFYGPLRVRQTFAIPGPGIERTLFNGTIEHGIQIFNDELRHRGTSYYAPDSGVGLALRFCCQGAPRRIGAVGLGAGTVAAYAQPGDTIAFYEIDPLVERLARARFAYLRECRAPVDVILGDARTSMEHEAPQNYDVLVLDAFSGDAVPVHLLTAQAIALYRRHLKPNGVLAFHVSSQYVDLAPVLAAEARHAGLEVLGVHSLANDEVGEFQADWVLMSADAAFFRQPEVAIASRPIVARPDLPLWTDDFNSLLPLVKWIGFENGAGSARPSAENSK